MEIKQVLLGNMQLRTKTGIYIFKQGKAHFITTQKASLVEENKEYVVDR